MRDRTTVRLAWGIAFVCFAMVSASLVLLYLDRAAIDSARTADLSALIGSVSAAVLGAVVASRQPKNPIGWLLLVIGVIEGIHVLTVYIAMHGLLTGTSPKGWPRWPAWAQSWLGNLALDLGILVFLLFPDGKPLSNRWRWIVRITVVYIVVFASFSLLDASPVRISPRLPSMANPIGLPGIARGSIGLFSEGLILLILGVASLVVRWRRSKGEERQQLKWFVLATAVSVVGFLLALILYASNPALSIAIRTVVNIVGFNVAVPVAIALAVLRYGLYEVDVVINKTVVYGLLAGFFTTVYVAVVVGVGTALGSTRNPFLTLLAAAVIALAFNPVRERARRFADRLVYGTRATPYEVLSQFSERMAGAYALDDILPKMARVLAEGTGGRAEIWLRLGSILRPVAGWPSEDLGARSTDMPITGDELPGFPAASKATPVIHQGELLGAISVTKPPNDPLRLAEGKLIDDVAAQAGLVLFNFRLIEDLRASRQRLVKAQDEERRRLERNIHDGAQQQLVALAVTANLAESFVGKDEGKARAMLAQLKAEATEALEDLRDLARGIYPPLLADKGLAVALEAQARKSLIPVSVEGDGIGRWPQEVEAAVYFCCLEALQNIAKYAKASTAIVRLANGGDTVKFEVIDDGAGFDPSKTGYGTGLQGIADRLDSLGGSLEVRSATGQGTTVAGRVPGVQATA